jgi:hypothetical protein
MRDQTKVRLESAFSAVAGTTLPITVSAFSHADDAARPGTPTERLEVARGSVGPQRRGALGPPVRPRRSSHDKDPSEAYAGCGGPARSGAANWQIASCRVMNDQSPLVQYQRASRAAFDHRLAARAAHEGWESGSSFLGAFPFCRHFFWDYARGRVPRPCRVRYISYKGKILQRCRCWLRRSETADQ